MCAESLTRKARLQWLTEPPTGVGRVRVASGAFAAVAISLAQEEPNPGETTPGELLSCTLAGYLGMHLALRMRELDASLSELVVDVELTVSPWPEYVTQRIEFSVLGRLGESGTIDQHDFRMQVEQALASVADSLRLEHGLTHVADARLQ